MGGGPGSPPHGIEEDEVTTRSSESDPEIVQINLAKNIQPNSPAPSVKSVLMYAKSKVYIHPTSYSRDNVSGWVSLVKRGKGDYLLSWIPESLLKQEDRDKFIQIEVGGDGIISGIEGGIFGQIDLASLR